MFKKVYPSEYRKALAEAAALARAEETERELLDSYAKKSGKVGPKVDAFEELKALSASFSVKNPPKALIAK